MAFTKVVGPGIHTLSNILSHNINSSGIITATKFVGPFDNAIIGGGTTISSDGINVTGIVTATGLDINGNGDISGNLVLGGDLTVNGTTTTLDTNLIGVDRIEVLTAGTNVAVAVTHNGSGDLIRLYDGSTQVVTVDDEGNVGIGTNTLFTGGAHSGTHQLTITNNSPSMSLGRSNTDQLYVRREQANGKYTFQTNQSGGNNGVISLQPYGGNVGIASLTPSAKLDVIGNTSLKGDLSVTGISTFSNNVHLLDGDRLRIGGSVGTVDGFELYHNALTSYITDSGTGSLIINSVAGSVNLRVGNTKESVRCLENGTTELYWNNNLRLKTNTDGIEVSKVGAAPQVSIAQTTTTAYSINGSISFINSSNTTAQIQGRTGSASTTGDMLFLCNAVGDETLAVLEDGKVRVPDRGSFVVGQGNDLTLKHNVTNSTITNTTGDLNIQSDVIRLKRTDAGQTFASFINNGQAEFSFSGNTKLSTSLTGITVTGEVAASQDYPDLRPTLDFNFAATKELDPKITYYRVGPASYVNEFGKIVLVGDNEPRFDHGYKYESSNGYSLGQDKCQGLLLEITRENLVKQSIYQSNDGKVQTTGTVNNWALLYTGSGTGSLTPGFDAPDGSKDAVRWTNNNTGHALLRLSIDSHTANGSDNYTLSFYVKGVSGTGNLHCDVHDGQPTIDWSGHMVTNEWRRIVVTGVAASGAKTFIDIVSNVNNNRVFDIWGVQLENGAYATSFIPTRGEKAVRGSEYVVVDEEDFAEFYNPLESSVLAVGRLQRPAASQGQLNILHIGDSNEDGHGVFREHGTKDVWYHIRNNNTTPTGGNLNPSGFGDWDADEEARIAIAFKDGDQAISVNGGNQVTAAVTSSYPTADITKMWIGSHGNGSFFEGTISRIAYYPKLLTDNQLNTLTA